MASQERFSSMELDLLIGDASYSVTEGDKFSAGPQLGCILLRSTRRRNVFVISLLLTPGNPHVVTKVFMHSYYQESLAN
jgi:hypothetical protein